MPNFAKAQPASGALLLISESGANSVAPHTPGANRPVDWAMTRGKSLYLCRFPIRSAAGVTPP
jgi:hypothetical protein